jgi:hypothetical protein
MKNLLVVLTALALTASVLPLGGAVTGAPDPALPYPEIPRISKEEVRAMLGNPDVVILDCRPVEQWRFSEQKLPGAVHEDPMNVPLWAKRYSKDKTIVIY